MSEPDLTTLSVRGDASVEVPPDRAEVTAELRVTGGSKADALHMLAVSLESVVTALDGLGGVPLTPETRMAALTWSAFSTNSWDEQVWRNAEERHVATGRVIAAVNLRIAVRDFAVLPGLGTVLGAQPQLHLHGVQWSADVDNPAWPRVRAVAIDAAIQKGRDYAGALGGTLLRIEHVADVGLLGNAGAADHHAVALSARYSRSVGGGDEGAAPALDPVPQQLSAVIEARFTASVRSLA